MNIKIPFLKSNNYILYVMICFFIFLTKILNAQSKDMDEIDLEIKKYLYKIQENDVDEEKLKELEKQIEYYRKSNFLNLKDELDKNSFEFSNVNTKNYVIQPKDTLFNIIRKFKMDLNQIYNLNPELKNKPLYIGQVIKVIDSSLNENKISDWKIETKEIFEDKTYRVSKGDTLSSIAKKFNVTIEELRKLNKLKKDSILKKNQKIIISRYKIIKEYKVRNYFIKPVDGYVTSTFGYRKNPFIDSMTNFHNGLDFAAPIGTPFFSAREGIVIFSGRMIGYGNCIFIRHPEGYISIYAHNKVNYVKVGDIVERGQKIGEVGRTGYATGPHLHFEIRKMEQVLNPSVALQWEERMEISNRRIALK